MAKGHVPWNKGKTWSTKIRKKISIATKGRPAWNKGIPHTEETKRKISVANTGNTWKLSDITKKRMSQCKKGEKNYIWKGNDVGYKALHAWIGRTYGNPKKCSHCGTTTAKRFEWANISGLYLRNIKDYTRLCRSCHKKFDDITKKLQGGE